MLGILVIASVNVINHAMLVSICIRKPVSRKRLVDKLAECSENIDEAKLSEVVLFEHINKCMFLHSLYCLGSNSLNSQHWGWC